MDSQLCSLNDLSDLEPIGFYLGDLPLHSGTADLAASGWQSKNSMFEHFQREEEKGRQLEVSLKERDEWKRKGDQLLNSMIPK